MLIYLYDVSFERSHVLSPWSSNIRRHHFCKQVSYVASVFSLKR